MTLLLLFIQSTALLISPRYSVDRVHVGIYKCPDAEQIYANMSIRVLCIRNNEGNIVSDNNLPALYVFIFCKE